MKIIINKQIEKLKKLNKINYLYYPAMASGCLVGWLASLCCIVAARATWVNLMWWGFTSASDPVSPQPAISKSSGTVSRNPPPIQYIKIILLNNDLQTCQLINTAW